MVVDDEFWYTSGVCSYFADGKLANPSEYFHVVIDQNIVRNRNCLSFMST